MFPILLFALFHRKYNVILCSIFVSSAHILRFTQHNPLFLRKHDMYQNKQPAISQKHMRTVAHISIKKIHLTTHSYMCDTWLRCTPSHHRCKWSRPRSDCIGLHVHSGLAYIWKKRKGTDHNYTFKCMSDQCKMLDYNLWSFQLILLHFQVKGTKMSKVLFPSTVLF